MEIRQLRLFVAAAEELHFARAAARELVTPSQVSARIAALEREVGARLFDRSTRQVQLTPPGEEFLVHARHILAEVCLAREHALCASATGARTIRLGWPAVGDPSLICRVMTDYCSAHPDVEVHWRVGHSGPLAIAVAHDELDAAFVYERQEPQHRLSFLPLYRHPLKVACAARHDLASADMVTPESLRAVAQIAFPPLHRYLYEELLTGARRVVEHGTSLQAVLGIVATGAGVAVRLEDQLPQWTGCGVVYRELAAPAPEVELGLVAQADAEAPLVSSLRTYAGAIARLGGRASDCAGEPNLSVQNRA